MMDDNFTQKLIVNLSKFKLSNDHLSLLSNDHLSLLSKGLNSCPTPEEPNHGHNSEELDSLHRMLRLNYHFSPHYEDPQAYPPTIEVQANFFSTEAFSHRKFQPKSTFKQVDP